MLRQENSGATRDRVSKVMCTQDGDLICTHRSLAAATSDIGGIVVRIKLIEEPIAFTEMSSGSEIGSVKLALVRELHKIQGGSNASNCVQVP